MKLRCPHQRILTNNTLGNTLISQFTHIPGRMKQNTQLITQLLRNLQLKTELTYLIVTSDKHTALISVKEGEISYLRYGSLVGMDALPSLQSMEVASISERKHSLEHSKGKRVLPPTQDILDKLSINLPNSWQEYQSRLEPVAAAVATAREPVATAVVSSPSVLTVAKDSGLIVPVEPKSAETPDAMVQLIRTALQQTLGPISEYIYEDAAIAVPKVNNRDDLARLINAVLEEIDENEYQTQFLKLLKEPLTSIVVIPT